MTPRMTESLRLERITALSISPDARRRSVPLAVVVQVMVLVLLTANLGRIPIVSTGGREAPLLVNDLAVLMIVTIGISAGFAARTFRVDNVTAAAALFAAIGAASAFVSAGRTVFRVSR